MSDPLEYTLIKRYEQIHEAYHLAKSVLAIHYGEQRCNFCDIIIFKPGKGLEAKENE